MTKEKAHKILSENVLNLITQGTDGFPCEMVEIETIQVKEDVPGDNGCVRLIGLMGKNAREVNTCYSFFIQQGLTVWYCDYFYQAMEVIEAMKIINNYKEEEE